MKNKVNTKNLIFLFIVGILILSGDFFLIKNNISFLRNSEKTEGIVTDILKESSSDGTTYRPEISFIDSRGENIIFSSSVSSSTSTYRKGEIVPVLYQKNNSSNAKINSFLTLWGAETILTFMGSILVISVIYTTYKNNKKSSLKNKLILNGTKIEAAVVSIDDNSVYANSLFSYKNLNIRKTYQIIAQWLNPSDNKMYIFNSDFINYNPKDIILDKKINVYIDRNNPQIYYMDLSNLPKEGN